MRLLDRRQMLLGIPAAAGFAAAGWAPAGWAMPVGKPRLLVLFLRGAYDCLSLLVPQGNDFYLRSRPTTAIPAARLASLADGWGLNMAGGAPLKPLWDKKQLAFVPFAGSSDVSRSHFETQDIIEYGFEGRNRSARSGFLNRLAVEIGAKGSAMAFAAELPIAMRGPLVIPNVALNSVGKLPESRRTALTAMYRQDAQLGAQVAEGLAAGAMVSATLAREMETSGRGAQAASAFEISAARIGLLMRDRIGLGFADIGGWDTHIGQAGALDFKLAMLSRGLAALATAMGPTWRDTAVLVISEFGRTFRENGSRGTDHGHGTSFMVLGGAVAGGRIAGKQARLTEAALHQNRDLPVLNDVRDVAGGLFARLYGLSPAAMARIFPGARASDLALL